VESRLAEAGTVGLGLSIVQRVLLAGRALWFYAGKVFWPHPLTFVYPRWNVNAAVASQYLFPLAALAVLIALWSLRRRLGKGPLAGVVCFAAMLLPVLGFFDIYFFRYSYVTDHFQYLACIGLIALAVGVGTRIARPAGQRGRQWAPLVAGALVLVLGVSTWRQTHVYKDLETLWRDTLSKNPNAWIAHTNLGIMLEERGQTAEAVEHYKQALRIKPDLAEVHNDLGVVLMLRGQLQEAIGHYRQALRLQPGQAKTHYNLGLALWQAGDIQAAIEQWELTLRISPDSADAQNNLGGALLRIGRVQEAIDHFEQALRIEPNKAEAHYNLGVALKLAGRVPEAIVQLEEAVRLNPGSAEARNSLARLRAAQ